MLFPVLPDITELPLVGAAMRGPSAVADVAGDAMADRPVAAAAVAGYQHAKCARLEFALQMSRRHPSKLSRGGFIVPYQNVNVLPRCDALKAGTAATWNSRAAAPKRPVEQQ
ncbi:MAG: hypothetical protein M3R68_03555 [Acidobacteriota bacterium]|nr:hypothetical protein [Acidobacteriota bacterium]